MKICVGVTDNQWFDYLRLLAARLAAAATPGGSSEPLDEVNFWQLAFDFKKIMTQKREKGTQTETEMLINYNDR